MREGRYYVARQMRRSGDNLLELVLSLRVGSGDQTNEACSKCLRLLNHPPQPQ